MTTLVGTDVSENLSCPIFILVYPSVSRTGFSPSYLTISLEPLMNDMIVLLPTPVSPIKITASLFYLSTGIASIPV